jgi:endonuclease-8
VPEGDTIHKIAAAMRPSLLGATLEGVRFGAGPGVVGPHRERLEGRRVTALHARGKHLFMELDATLLLRIHLGMYGSWHRYRPEEPWRRPPRQASLELRTEQDVFVCFNAREVEVLEASSIRALTLEQRLGPDLLVGDVDLEGVVGRAREFVESDSELIDVLLDQRVAAGIGNVYKSEILFLEHQNPWRTLAQTPDAILRRLYETAGSLLRRNLGGGPRVTRFTAESTGTLWVYGRGGKPCFRCGAVIRYQRLGRDLRSTYWCPGCQSP